MPGHHWNRHLDKSNHPIFIAWNLQTGRWENDQTTMRSVHHDRPGSIPNGILDTTLEVPYQGTSAVITLGQEPWRPKLSEKGTIGRPSIVRNMWRNAWSAEKSVHYTTQNHKSSTTYHRPGRLPYGEWISSALSHPAKVRRNTSWSQWTTSQNG